MTYGGRGSPGLFGRVSWEEARRVADILRKETIGGALLLGGAVVAMAWANSPWADGYEAVRTAHFGPAVLHLRLDLKTWAADGLLAIFFFVAGLELKREFVAGELRHLRRADPKPALAWPSISSTGSGPSRRGWPCPSSRSCRRGCVSMASTGS
ncbi:Na+/H+ antiporter NhaA [Nonomuraea sp. NPDC047897]|uniref:Na+/H+ antiporter NhaA n=1 Tax=Nonomuraea sp. NPDC047897 TaxID=3364346 RepID=UPI00371B3B01